MTSLSAEAASFFSCRVGMMGQSGPQDVTCGVFVCRCDRSVGRRLFRLRDAVRAVIRRECEGTAVGGPELADLGPGHQAGPRPAISRAARPAAA